MQIRNLKFVKFNRAFHLIFLLIFLSLFQACKKADISESPLLSTKETPVAISEQPKDFFMISPDAPDAVKIIAAEMQNQFKEKDIQDFLNWHGLPLWNKVIKFEKDNKGSVSYAIPTQKKGELTDFFAATIYKDGKIKFEIHRKAAILSNKTEYSYANISLNRSKAILDYFNGKSKANSDAATSGTK